MCKIDHWYGHFKKVVGMSQYFITSDVHGFFDELMVALNSKEFDVNNNEIIKKYVENQKKRY